MIEKSKDHEWEIIKNRLYECEGCGFIGKMKEAEEHQIKCEYPMHPIRK